MYRFFLKNNYCLGICTADNTRKNSQMSNDLSKMCYLNKIRGFFLKEYCMYR